MSNNFLNNTPGSLEQVLKDTNRQLQERQVQEAAKNLHVPYVNLHNFPVDLQVLGLFTETEAKSLQAVPFFMEQNDLRIGAVQPSLPGLLEKVSEFKSRYKVTLYIISPASLNQMLSYFAKVSHIRPHTDETIRVTAVPEALTAVADPELQKKKSISELLALLFGNAVGVDASDIHIEPEAGFAKVRLRIDGVLHDMLHLEKPVYSKILSRIKIQSGLKLNVDNTPQDGRLTIYYLGKPIDVRVSTLPSAFGEGLVMRLLGTSAVRLKLADLGLMGEARSIIESELQKPNGMIITTGPTGSGKTTTLYAFLNELNEPGIKIITLEDPVEYKLEGIQQTPIDHAAHLDFASGLRAILRQDPDIVMVGEIRDLETADTACNASLTGHLVFSTLHTNDAAGAIPRLQNMGVKPFVLAPALSVIIAQRLVRKLCSKCIEPAVLPPQTMERVMNILKAIPAQSKVNISQTPQFYHARGCPACHNLGYKGRIGIYEVIKVTDQLKDLIHAEVTNSAIKKFAAEQGWLSLVQDGLLKAMNKVTDIEEVFRVAGE